MSDAIQVATQELAAVFREEVAAHGGEVLDLIEDGARLFARATGTRGARLIGARFCRSPGQPLP